MSQFGKSERAVARLLAKSPRAKAAVKWLYARSSYVLHRDGAEYRCRHALKAFGADSAETFFGYYDKKPQSPNGEHLLWCETLTPTSRPPDPEKPIAIVVADAEGVEQRRLKTRAYNWQQGARQQWLDNQSLAFNDFDVAGRRHIARIVTTSGHELSVLPLPLADAHAGSGIGVSVSFRRLASLRPDYGYFNLGAESLDRIERCPSNDGLWQISLSSGRADLVISLAELARDSSPDAIHKINHPMISPDGSRCIFLHRFLRNGVRTDRLMLLEFTSGKTRPLVSGGMVSHMAWRSDAELIGYLRDLRGRDGFFTVDADSGRLEVTCEGVLNGFGDGHPSIIDGRFVVWDTYPDKARKQHLFRLDLDADEPHVEELGSFHHGFRYHGVSRCDLHPRFGIDFNEVFFDSVCGGLRRLWRLRLREECRGADNLSNS